jgi:uncharacterized protein YqgC (DUF456 family)
MLLSIFVVPLGLPGTFFMVAAAIAADYFASAGIGWIAIGIALALAVTAEVLEWTLSARFAQKYGGSKRAGWGAIIGGFLGAFIGIPVPVIGSMIGAFAGAFVGALVAETQPQRMPDRNSRGHRRWSGCSDRHQTGDRVYHRVHAYCRAHAS